MSEDNRGLPPEEEQNSTNPLQGLFDIVNDLWGETQSDSLEEADKAAAPASEKTAAAGPAPTQAPAPGKKPEKNASASFEDFWKGVDETVDWTEILVSPTQTDFHVPPELWQLYHEQAEAVLSGDLNAYAEVLRAGQPLKDLQPYTGFCRIAIRSADRVTVTFSPSEEWLERREEETLFTRYLCGMALRCARDVLSLLPLREVEVKAVNGEETLLRAVYPREKLRRLHFNAVDPVALANE